METKYVSVSNVIIREGFNPRENYGNLDELKSQLLKTGQTDPVRVVYNDDGTVTLGAQGHRRLEALKALNDEGYSQAENGNPLELLTLPEGDITEEERTVALITLNSGKPLEFLEAATVFARLVGEKKGKERKEAVDAITAKTGFTRTHINNSLMVLTAPEPLLELIKSGKVSATLAIELYVEHKDWDKVLAVVEKALAKAQAEGKTKASKKDTKGEGDGEGKTKASKKDTKGEGDGEGDEGDDEGDDEGTEDKRLGLIGKRIIKAITDLLKDQEGLEKSDVLYKAYETAIVALVHVSGETHPNENGFEPTLGDVKVQAKTLARDLVAENKSQVEQLKAAHKEVVASLKEDHKAKVEELKAKIKEAKSA